MTGCMGLSAVQENNRKVAECAVWFIKNSSVAIQKAHPDVKFRQGPHDSGFDLHVHVPSSDGGNRVSVVSCDGSSAGSRAALDDDVTAPEGG